MRYVKLYNNDKNKGKSQSSVNFKKNVNDFSGSTFCKKVLS